MKSFAYLLLAVTATGCITEPATDEDGRDDSFTDGKADTGGIVEGSPEALGVLRVANERSEIELHDHGVPTSAAHNVIAGRAGDDEELGTTDDTVYTSLAQLDAVPFVGPVAFARMRAYATDLGYLASTTSPATPPADLWNVAGCAPITWAQALAHLGPGELRYDYAHPVGSVRGRHRDMCNSITGCTPWMPGATVAYPANFGPTLGELPVANLERGIMTLDVVGRRIYFAFAGQPGRGINFACGALTETEDEISCSGDTYDQSSNSNNPQRLEFNYWEGGPPLALLGTICANGSFHFRSLVTNDSSNQSRNLNQIAFYGHL